MAKANPIDEAKDLQHMLVDYAKQETIEPLKTLARYLSRGFLGSVLVFLGFFFLSLGILRGLQRVSTFNGSSWGSLAPYSLTLLIMALMLVLLVYLSFRKSMRAVSSIDERPY